MSHLCRFFNFTIDFSGEQSERKFIAHGSGRQMLGRCKRALARAAPATSKKITGTRGTGDRMRRFMLMLSFDSPPPHWWLTPGGANATRLSNLPYSRRQVSVTHSLRSGFWLFYCLTRGSATSSLHPALTAAVPERDSNFRSLRSPINYNLRCLSNEADA